MKMIKKIQKYHFEIIVFFLDAIYMILELAASRIISPYFGSTNDVWTAVIGIILLSSSIGNYIGGKMADKAENNLEIKIIVKKLLMLSGISLLILSLIYPLILEVVSHIVTGNKIGSITVAIILFLIPSVTFGAIPTIILKNVNENTERDKKGKTIGRIHSVQTLGGLTGTFIGGFFLIPYLGVNNILYIMALIPLLLVFFVGGKRSYMRNEYKKQNDAIIIISIVVICITAISITNDIKSLNNIDALPLYEEVSIDTNYGHVTISHEMLDNKKIRTMKIDGGYESATYVDERDRNDLVFDYLKLYDMMYDDNYKYKKSIENVLMIGGAAYQYPKYFLANHEGNMDVVEIDSKVTKIAKEYFYLDEAISQYSDENKRLSIFDEDGRTYLNNNSKKYDVVLNDAFAAETPAKTLTTLEAAEKVKDSLSEHGLYMTNVISAVEGRNSRFLRSEVLTLKQVFKNVHVYKADDTCENSQTQNLVVIATDESIAFDKKDYTEYLDFKGLRVLTDDFCPIENLIIKS